MKPASAKNKGRKFQQRFRDQLLELDPDGMYESRSMGANGSDILDPGRRLPFHYLELRKHETWPSLNSVTQEMAGKAGARWLYLLGKNNTEPIAIVSMPALRVLLAAWFEQRKLNE